MRRCGPNTGVRGPYKREGEGEGEGGGVWECGSVDVKQATEPALEASPSTPTGLKYSKTSARWHC